MNKQIIDEAAQWFVEFSTEEADAEAKDRFDAWMRKSPEHVRVYLELLPLWDEAAMALPGDNTCAEELITLAHCPDNVLPLERSGGDMSEAEQAEACLKTLPTPQPAVSGPRRWALAASILLVLLGSAFVVWFQGYRAPDYATKLGEQRTITLSDGSSVELNTQSRLRVKFTPETREVELLAGQALFRVAKDPQRPFTVISDVTRVRAVGTQFDVYRKISGTTVTVLEGKVAIAQVEATAADGIKNAALSPQNPVLLSAGQQLTLSAATPGTPQPANVTSATAWTQGRLIFEATPLPEVAAEFNRYNTLKIEVQDPRLQDFLVNGSFKSSDARSLVHFLRQQPELSVREDSSAVQITRE